MLSLGKPFSFHYGEDSIFTKRQKLIETICTLFFKNACREEKYWDWTEYDKLLDELDRLPNFKPILSDDKEKIDYYVYKGEKIIIT
jgi:hypothetical protein